MSDQISKLALELKKFRKANSTKHYPKEIKERVLVLINEGHRVKDLSEALSIHPATLSIWKNGRAKKQVQAFHQAIVVDDNPEIKVAIISGLKLSDLQELL
jgi:hypothetical protein